MSPTCVICHGPMSVKVKGRPRLYCSDECARTAERAEEKAAAHERLIERFCPSCKTRYRLPGPRETYSPSSISKREFRWLENAARNFDKLTEDGNLTAAEFIAWVRPDVGVYRDLRIPVYEGKGREEQRVTLPDAWRKRVA